MGDYGPGLDKSIEVGDVFWSFKNRDECAIVGKRYNDDMTITYQVRYGRSGRSYWAEEFNFHRGPQKRFTRIKVAARTIIQTEKTYTGVTLWNSKKLMGYLA